MAQDTADAAIEGIWRVMMGGPQDTSELENAERQSQAVLLRDIFGNPFRPAAAFDPVWLAWNDATIPRIAQAIYDERRFEDLPVLADALEEAGCTNGDILGHCRSDGPHVRGCWVVDLVLEKK